MKGVSAYHNRGNPQYGEASSYTITQVLRVQTAEMRTMEASARETAALLERDVLVQEASPRYLFTRLNEIKPDMIGQATRAAREAADKFAQDSSSGVGPILRAQQGWFSILPRGGGEHREEQSVEKTVRVITTIDFLLEE